jgi:GYF domain 2
MSNRAWFYAANGQQQGPYPEAQLRDLITRGTVGPDTLVWTDGMSGWQRAGEIPGLISGGGSSPPPVYAQPGGPSSFATESYGGGAMKLDVGVWELLWRSIAFFIGMVLVIPAPWVATWYYRWIISRLYVPGRPNLAFNGQPLDIWYVFIAIGLLTYIGSADIYGLQYLSIPIQAVLSWMVIRWIAANLSSDGQPLPIGFNGSVLGYVGWQVLLYVSFITIIGWAWVVTAWMRWICRNIDGTHREVIFTASGLDVLWRTVVFVIACIFIIPIPWVLGWFARWYASQFAMAERGAPAEA